MNKGWVCPKCGDVYAPFVGTCGKCNNNKFNSDQKAFDSGQISEKEKKEYFEKTKVEFDLYMEKNLNKIGKEV